MRKSNQQAIGEVIRKLLKNQKLEGRLKELDVLKLKKTSPNLDLLNI